MDNIKKLISYTADQLIDAGFGDVLPSPNGGLSDNEVGTVVNAFFAIAALIALIMIIIGGYWYVLSGADPQKTKKAKDTILYAVIGLVLSVSAWAIISFILERT